jgi:hypothetical protein
VALLLLTVHGYEMPNQLVGMDFYRQALDLDLRGKREYTDAVLAALGGISKSDLAHHKALLKLCDEAVEMADRKNVDESLLFEIAQVENFGDQVEYLRQVIERGLTRKELREIIKNGIAGDTIFDDDSLHRLPKAAMQIAKLALKPDTQVDAHRIAEAFVNLERDKGVAKARIKALREMLEEAEMYIDGV